MTETFPLQWPVNRTRTILRVNSAFNTTPAKAKGELLRELDLMNANNIVISSNANTVQRGENNYLHTGKAKLLLDDPGVAVYYSWKNEQYVLACDKYKTVTDNLQALNKTVNAIRGIERWGTGDMMKAAFSGFKALAEPVKKTCWDILQLRPADSEIAINQQYRTLAKRLHPDNGGSNEAMQELNEAYKQAMSKLRKQ